MDHVDQYGSHRSCGSYDSCGSYGSSGSYRIIWIIRIMWINIDHMQAGRSPIPKQNSLFPKIFYTYVLKG